MDAVPILLNESSPLKLQLENVGETATGQQYRNSSGKWMKKKKIAQNAVLKTSIASEAAHSDLQGTFFSYGSYYSFQPSQIPNNYGVSP